MSLPPPHVIHPWSLESIGQSMVSMTSTGRLLDAASAAWPTTNKAFFVPFLLRRPAIATNLWTYNGLTVNGSLDIGIFTHDGTRLISTGSTAQSGTGVLQTFNLGTFHFGPGLFYMALAFNGDIATMRRNSQVAAQYLAAMGVKKLASAFPLPATATLEDMDATYLPVFGLLLHPRTVI